MSIYKTIDEMLISFECVILGSNNALLNKILHEWNWLDIFNEHISIIQYKKLIKIIMILSYEKCIELLILFDRSFTNIKNQMCSDEYYNTFILPLCLHYKKPIYLVKK